jgi:hypothetical protein
MEAGAAKTNKHKEETGMKKGLPAPKRKISRRCKMLLKEVRLNGQEVQCFDLFQFKHFWLSPDTVALQTASGWEVFNIVKWEEATDTPTLLVRYVGRFSSLLVEV